MATRTTSPTTPKPNYRNSYRSDNREGRRRARRAPRPISANAGPFPKSTNQNDSAHGEGVALSQRAEACLQSPAGVHLLGTTGGNEEFRRGERHGHTLSCHAGRCGKRGLSGGVISSLPVKPRRSSTLLGSPRRAGGASSVAPSPLASADSSMSSPLLLVPLERLELRSKARERLRGRGCFMGERGHFDGHLPTQLLRLSAPKRKQSGFGRLLKQDSGAAQLGFESFRRPQPGFGGIVGRRPQPGRASLSGTRPHSLLHRLGCRIEARFEIS